MNKIDQFLSYFNPFSEELQLAKNSFCENLSPWQKAAAIAASIFAGVFGLGISSIAAFRFTVEKLSPHHDPVTVRTQKASNGHFQTECPDENEVQSPDLPVAIKNEPPLPILSHQALSTLLTCAEFLAPDKESAYKIDLDEGGELSTYSVWFDLLSKKVNILRHEDQSLTTLASSKKNIPCKNADTITRISEELANAKSETAANIQQNFGSAVNLVQKFFLKPDGENYTKRRPLTVGQFKLWFGTSKIGNFLLHIKAVDESNHTQKLSLSISKQGVIERVYLNAHPVSPESLAKSEGQNAQFLRRALLGFLRNHAINLEDGPFVYTYGLHQFIFNSRLNVHSTAIEQLPEEVLKLLCRQQLIKFLSDDLTASPGIDGGGLKRQLFTELALHLFDESPNRKIKVSYGVPIMQNTDSEEEKELLKLAGNHLIKTALLNDEVTIGNVLDPAVYSCIKLLILFDNTLTEDSMMDAAQCLCSEDKLAFLFEVFQRPRPLSTDEALFLTDVLEVVDEVPTSLAEIKDLAQIIILKELNYRDKILAIHYMVEGMMGIELAEILATRLLLEPIWENMTEEQLSERIQGVKLDPQGISDRIFTNSDDPVVIQKCAWLQEYILESDAEEIERFLKAVTGSTTVTAATRIELQETPAFTCSASTCPKIIYVPRVHTDVGTDATEEVSDKEKFLNNFKLIYSETGFDMG